MKHKSLKRTMRKRNMKIFPKYKMLSWDYLFFYAIDFLFLTQVKNISAANLQIKLKEMLLRNEKLTIGVGILKKN